MSRKQKTGIVVSDKMDKTIVVEVTRKKMHPIYKKYVRVRKKFMAHDEEKSAGIGDFVRIEESRPFSKNKSWVLTEVIRRAPGAMPVAG
jgi:small subunit ribosomal protein S17